MGTSFRPYSPDQELLLPPRLNEWLAYFISDVVEELDLSAFYARYEADGRRKSPFDPRMMLKVLIYAYATGTFSPRKIAREAELNSLGTLVIDGAKVKANASKHKAMSYGRLQEEGVRLSKEVDELYDQARAVDDAEGEQFGSAQRGDELPEELQHRQSRLSKIRAAKARLEAEQAQADNAKDRHPDDERRSPRGGRNFKRDCGVPDDKAQSNFTDPESRIMKTITGFEQCCNGQLAVDGEFQIIVANHQGNNASDNGCLMPLLDEVEATLRGLLEPCLATAKKRISKPWKRKALTAMSR